MIMAPAPPALMSHREDWNRSDSTSPGTDWRLDFNTMKIATNRSQFKTPANGDGRAGVWLSYMGVASAAYNGGRLLTDNWAIEAQLIAPIGNAATDNLTCIGGGMLDGGPASGMVLGYMCVTTGNGQSINTYANASIASPGAGSGQTNQTQRNVIATNVSGTALIRIERRMYSATQSIIKGYVNGSNTTTWDDSGGVMPSGDILKRRWFIQHEGNFPIFQSGFYSPAIDWVRAYDLYI